MTPLNLELEKVHCRLSFSSSSVTGVMHQLQLRLSPHVTECTIFRDFWDLKFMLSLKIIWARKYTLEFVVRTFRDGVPRSLSGMVAGYSRVYYDFVENVREFGLSEKIVAARRSLRSIYTFNCTWSFLERSEWFIGF